MVALGLPVGFDRQVTTSATRNPRCVAGVALNFLVLVRQIRCGDIETPVLGARVVAHELRARRFLVVLIVIGIDAVLDEAEFPFDFGIEGRTLDQLAITPLEALLAVTVAVQAHVGATRRRRGAGGAQVGISLRCAVAILALNLDRAGDFTIQVTVAVIVLGKVAVNAVHALVDMN